MKSSASSLDLSKRFILLFGAIVLFTGFSARMFYVRQERTDLDLRLKEKATFINSFYSFLIADSLMRKDDVTLFQVVNRLEEDPEIIAVVVVDQKQAVRYHADPQKIGTLLDDASIKHVMESGEMQMANYQNAGGRAMVLISPLKIQGAPMAIGAVRIDFTFNHIEAQVNASQQRYWFIIFATLSTTTGLIILFLTRWVLAPLQAMKAGVAAINPVHPEPNLPEMTDELGQVNTAINDLVLRFKAESQRQSSQQLNQGEQEKTWVRRLANSFLPGARVIIADKDNRVAYDSGDATLKPGKQLHLMDLIKDTDFANLLNSAFHKEGEAVEGPVTFQDKTYKALILSVPAQQTVVVKTLIALQLNPL